MHSLGTGLATGLDDLVDQQIALRRSRRSDQDRMIGHFDMKRVAVSLGIDGDGLYPHAPGSLDDPASDLAAICNQNSFEHVLAYLPTLLATSGAGSAPAIWHAGPEVTIPSYSKKSERQRSDSV